MSGHTPGPWQVREWPHEWTIEHAYPAHSELAVLSKGSFDDPLPNEGNAYLMAAAPELLEAANRVLHEVFMNAGAPNSEVRTTEALSILAEAVAKAEGRE